jgi:hypothetical protein
MESAPIIVTAVMGSEDQRRYNRLRQLHFPPERNFLDAHITLFHHLPPSALPEIKQRLASLAKEFGPPVAQVAGLINLGCGVAYQVESADLMAIRNGLADAFAGMLTPQDLAQPRLHITIQNKVEPATARITLRELSRDFAPQNLSIIGLAAFHYLGGPWAPIGQWNFRGKSR